MKVIEKVENSFEVFDWLNFESLPESDGHKFELYSDTEITISEFMLLFYSLFNRFLDEILITTFRPDGQWGNFCIDTWDINKDQYDYSPNNKSKPTSNYLKMLMKNEIDPSYSGFCRCLDWDQFLPVILDCVLQHTAPYSLMFYIPQRGIVFYFHHTGSFGIYYKEIDKDVRHIVRRSKIEDLEIKYADDDRLLKFLPGSCRNDS